MALRFAAAIACADGLNRLPDRTLARIEPSLTAAQYETAVPYVVADPGARWSHLALFEADESHSGCGIGVGLLRRHVEVGPCREAVMPRVVPEAPAHDTCVFACRRRWIRRVASQALIPLAAEGHAPWCVVELPRRLRRPCGSGHPPGCSPFDKYETDIHNDGHGRDDEESGVDLVHVE